MKMTGLQNLTESQLDHKAGKSDNLQNAKSLIIRTEAKAEKKQKDTKRCPNGDRAVTKNSPSETEWNEEIKPISVDVQKVLLSKHNLGDNMPNVKRWVRINRPGKDGTVQVWLIIHLDKRKSEFQTGIYIKHYLKYQVELLQEEYGDKKPDHAGEG